MLFCMVSTHILIQFSTCLTQLNFINLMSPKEFGNLILFFFPI